MTGKFDGLALEVEKPGRMTIVHPVTRQPLADAKGAPAWVDVYSSDSEVARSAGRRAINERLGRRARSGLTAEQIEDNEVDLLAALVAGWRLLALDGEPLDVAFSAEAAQEMLRAPGMAWLREQIDAYASDRGNFSTASSRS